MYKINKQYSMNNYDDEYGWDEKEVTDIIEIGSFRNFKDAFKAVVEKEDKYDPWKDFEDYKEAIDKYGWTGYIRTIWVSDVECIQYYIEKE